MPTVPVITANLTVVDPYVQSYIDGNPNVIGTLTVIPPVIPRSILVGVSTLTVVAPSINTIINLLGQSEGSIISSTLSATPPTITSDVIVPIPVAQLTSNFITPTFLNSTQNVTVPNAVATLAIITPTVQSYIEGNPNVTASFSVVKPLVQVIQKATNVSASLTVITPTISVNSTIVDVITSNLVVITPLVTATITIPVSDEATLTATVVDPGISIVPPALLIETGIGTLSVIKPTIKRIKRKRNYLRQDGFTVIDKSSNGDVRPQQPGRCLTFNGTDQYVEFGDVLKPAHVSMVANVRLTSTKTVARIGGHTSSGNVGYGLTIEGSDFGWKVESNTQTATTPTTATWYQVIGTYDGDKQRLYVNGNLLVEDSVVSGDIDYTGLSSFKLGQWNGSDFWHGELFDIIVYGRALIAREIQAIYDTFYNHYKIFPGFPLDYIGRFPLDNHNTTQTIGTHQNGTIVNGATLYEGLQPYSVQNLIGYTPSDLGTFIPIIKSRSNTPNNTYQGPYTASQDEGDVNDITTGTICGKLIVGTVGSDSSIIQKKSTLTGIDVGYSLYVTSGGSIVFYVTDGTNAATATAAISVSEDDTISIVAVVDANDIHIYVDSVLYDTTDRTSVSSFTNSQSFLINDSDNGTMSNVEVHDTIFTAQDAADYQQRVMTTYHGRVPRDVKLHSSPCFTADGSDDFIAEAGLSGSETVVSSEGTSTPSISAGQIDFTAGTCWNLLLSNGSHYPMCEGAGDTIHDTVNGNHGTITNGQASNWETTQDVYHYAISEGFWLYTHATLADLNSPVQTTPPTGYTLVEYRTGTFHNGARTKVDFNPEPLSPDLQQFDLRSDYEFDGDSGDLSIINDFNSRETGFYLEI